ncbi:hypothetical protein KAR91_40910 [Candidatus Pacearchaeota archaeon]|nr:hypothetical protein [Candidatus Pacearchaeota archaeon]
MSNKNKEPEKRGRHHRIKRYDKGTLYIGFKESITIALCKENGQFHGLELSLEEARKVYDQLHRIFDKH